MSAPWSLRSVAPINGSNFFATLPTAAWRRLRNTGLRHLDTDLVMFLDADDLLVPGALDGAVASFKPLWQDAAIAGVHGQLIRVPEETDPADLEAWSGTFKRPLIDWIGYRGECPFSVHAVVSRRVVIDSAGGFDESVRGGAEDWDLWFRLLRHGYRFAANENLVGAYRLRQTSMFRDQQTTHVARGRQAVRRGREVGQRSTRRLSSVEEQQHRCRGLGRRTNGRCVPLG